MTSIKTVLEHIKAPKALQTQADSGYVLRQTLPVAEGTPVFAPAVKVPDNVAAEQSNQTSNEKSVEQQ